MIKKQNILVLDKIKIILIILSVILAISQYRFWFAEDGLLKIFYLKNAVNEMQIKNDEIAKHNDYLASEIKSLKSGGAEIENRARNDLGMVKKGEIFYQVVK